MLNPAIGKLINACENRYKLVNKIAKKAREVSAEAEAKSMAIRANALTQNKALVEYEAVQKWDGKLPQYMMGNSVPFVNLK
jgi:DNA-directed RNA polymerase subunit K/omega